MVRISRKVRIATMLRIARKFKIAKKVRKVRIARMAMIARKVRIATMLRIDSRSGFPTWTVPAALYIATLSPFCGQLLHMKYALV